MLRAHAGVAGTAAAAALIALAVASSGAGAAPGSDSQGDEQQCIPRTNATAIIDDSGSMADKDPQRLRVAAVESFIDHRRNAGRILTAIEFGNAASTVFAPTMIASNNRQGLVTALRSAIVADEGGTDYNEAFKKAADASPQAQARIFLTDGEHNDGEYTNVHRGGPPTYVVGLGVAGAGANQLRNIAAETSGRFFDVVQPGDFGPVLNRITAALSCIATPVTRRIPSPAPRRSRVVRTPLLDTDRTVEFSVFDEADRMSANELLNVSLLVTENVPDRNIVDPRDNRGRVRMTSRVWEIRSVAGASAGARAAANENCTVRRLIAFRTREIRRARTRPVPGPRLNVSCRASSRFVHVRVNGRGRSLLGALRTQKFGVRVRADRSAPPTPRNGLTIQFMKIDRRMP